MQKKKLKLNVVDVAIFAVIVCSVAVLIFRDTINEFLTKPEILTYQVNISVDGAGNVDNVIPSVGQIVLFESELEDGEPVEMTVVSAEPEINPVAASDHAEVVIIFNGYRRFGKYYTENGERIYNYTDCTFYYEDEPIEGTVVSIVKIDE